MAYAKKLGRAFINLMIWYATRMAALLLFSFPVHLSIYHYLLREPIPEQLIVADTVATPLGILVLYRYVSRKRQAYGSAARMLYGLIIWIGVTVAMVALIIGSVDLQGYLSPTFAWQDKDHALFVAWFFASVIAASYLKSRIDKRVRTMLQDGHARK